MADESNDLCVCGHARLYHLTGVGDCEPLDVLCECKEFHLSIGVVSSACECFPGGWVGSEWQEPDNRNCPIHWHCPQLLNGDQPIIICERERLTALVAAAHGSAHREAAPERLPRLPA
jgi:hypothetical protein